MLIKFFQPFKFSKILKKKSTFFPTFCVFKVFKTFFSKELRLSHYFNSIFPFIKFYLLPISEGIEKKIIKMKLRHSMKIFCILFVTNFYIFSSCHRIYDTVCIVCFQFLLFSLLTYSAQNDRACEGRSFTDDFYFVAGKQAPVNRLLPFCC